MDVEDPSTRLSAARVLLPGGQWSGPASIELRDGCISRLVAGADAAHGVLTPGLIDLHNNGAFGIDFATAAPAERDDALRQLACHGVTAVQPTVITGPLPAMLAAMDRIVATPTPAIARILGVHLEGPFLAPARRGAHRADWLQDPAPAAIDALLAHPGGLPRTITLAPERPHALAAIRRLVEAGIVVALGHCDATASETGAALDAGATMATHLFNAMRPFAHRDPGLAGVALTDPRLCFGLIADGLHVDPIACRLAFHAAPGRVIAVSDSILLAGLPRGATRPFGGLPATLDAHGMARRADGTIAGAGIVLDEGVRRLIAAGIDPAAVLRACTETPADAIARPDLGRIAPGARADLVWWDADWIPRRVWIDGVEVTHAH